MRIINCCHSETGLHQCTPVVFFSPVCVVNGELAARSGAGGAGIQVELGGQVGADPGDAVERELGERPVPFGDQVQEPGRLGRLPRMRRGRRPAAGGGRALGQDPGAEPGQGGSGGQGQADYFEGRAAPYLG